MLPALTLGRIYIFEFFLNYTAIGVFLLRVKLRGTTDRQFTTTAVETRWRVTSDDVVMINPHFPWFRYLYIFIVDSPFRVQV